MSNSDTKIIDTKEEYKIKKIIEKLGDIKGRHTELVSVYIPTGYNLVDVINQLKEEQGTAANIKSKSTRKNVTTALEKIIQHLKVFKKTPKNGIIVFCGNVSETEGKDDITLWSIEPPQKLKTKIYWCDQEFVMDPLKEMVKEKEVYGLIVLDAREATIGLLKGKNVQRIRQITSTVPSKTVKGGMCLSPDTLIQLHDGRISEIGRMGKDDNPILSADLFNYKTIFALHNDIMERPVKSALRMITKAPSFEITVTPEHRFFVPHEEGFDIVYAEDLRAKDDIFIAKNIDIDPVLPRFRSKFLNHSGEDELSFYQILGYMFGDGCKDTNRIILYDKDEQLINDYRKIAERLFKVDTGFRKRVRKLDNGRTGRGSYELNIYSKELMDTISEKFYGILETERYMHPIIHRLPKKQLARFISGLFDAEGSVDENSGTVRITMSDKSVIKTLQLMLLRYSIVSSYRKELYKGKYEKHHLVISEYNSLEEFKKTIGFLSEDKSLSLNNILSNGKRQSYADQIPAKGSFIMGLARELNLNTEDFDKTQNFFYDERRQSFDVFRKNILEVFKKRMDEIDGLEIEGDESIHQLKKFRESLKITQKELANELDISATTISSFENRRMSNEENINELKNEISEILSRRKSEMLQRGKMILDILNKLSNSDITIAQIKSIERVDVDDKFYDISIPVSQNFLANGIIVHNSQHRYDRIREDAVHHFLTRVGDKASKILLKYDLKGVILGGPGPIKDRFEKGKYLNYMIKKKLLGVRNTGYTDEHGLHELVDRSEELLKKSKIVHERNLLKEFFTRLEKQGAVSYGIKEVQKALDYGAVDTLLISEEFDWVQVNYECQCGHQVKKNRKRKNLDNIKCDECGGWMKPDKDEMVDLVDLLIDDAEDMSTKVEMISTETTEGIQFKEIGGIGAILRFKID